MDDYELSNAASWNPALRHLVPKTSNDVEGQMSSSDADNDQQWQMPKKKHQQKPPHQRPRATDPLPRQVQQQPKYQWLQYASIKAATQANSAARPPSQQRKPTRFSGPMQPTEATQPRKLTPVQTLDTSSTPPRSKLNSQSDDDAQVAWRQNRRPETCVRVPVELVLQDKSYETIASQHGTFVHIRDTSKRRRGDEIIELGIWGGSQAARMTSEAIMRWVAAMRPTSGPKHAADFGKVVSLTAQDRAKAEKRFWKDVQRHQYRQNPKPDMVFGAVASFHWPTRTHGLQPVELLGKSLEALDPIRMACKCHIVCEGNLLQVSGHATDVQTALDRLRKCCFQISAQQLRPARAYFLHWSIGGDVPTPLHLRLHEYPTVRVIGAQSLGSEIQFSPRAIISRELSKSACTPTTASDISGLRNILATTLAKLHYYRGYLQLRVRLGTFLLVNYQKTLTGQDGTCTFDRYIGMTKMAQFSGMVTDELGDFNLEGAALSVLTKAPFLQAESVFSGDSSDCQTGFSTLFTFEDSSGNLQLAISWQEVNGSFVADATHWTRLDRGAEHATKLLDTSVTDLYTSRAWQFEILASKSASLSHLPKNIADFQESLKINKSAALSFAAGIDPSALFVHHRPSASLRGIRQAACHRFNMIDTDLIVELSRFQNFTFLPLATTPSPSPPIMQPPRIGLEVYRSEWRTLLSTNERLEIGSRAVWDDDLDAWFPPPPKDKSSQDASSGDAPDDDEDGLVAFTRLLARLEGLFK